jgi:hypothetical protein
MTETRDRSAVVRLNAIQQHLSNNTKPSSTGKADNFQPSPTEGQKYYPKPEPFDPFRPVKVGSPLLIHFQSESANCIQTIIVGTGICGVAAAVLLSRKVKNHTVKVYEKNSRVVRF